MQTEVELENTFSFLTHDIKGLSMQLILKMICIASLISMCPLVKNEILMAAQ